MAHYLQEAYAVSLRRSLRISNVSSCMWYYNNRDRGDQWLRMRMKEIAAVRVRYGFERILVMLRREGFKDNHKRVYRVYREGGLNLRSKRPRRSRSGAHRLERVDIPAINRVWSMDFLQDALFNGQRFCVLAMVDNYSKKCLLLLVGKSLRGEHVRNELSQVCKEESCFHERIHCDNGNEFISKEVDRWAYETSHWISLGQAYPRIIRMSSPLMVNSGTNACR
jgi:putative transposase